MHRWSWAIIDGTVWVVAVFAATWLRYDFEVSRLEVVPTAVFAAVAVMLHLAVGALVGPYAVGHKRGSFEEAADIVKTALLTTAALFTWAALAERIVVPRSVPLVAGVVALSAMAAARFLLRAARMRQAANRPSERRVVVFGAGDAGRHLVRGMLRDDESGLLPVALLDDDRTKRRLTIDGVRVRGTRTDLQEVAERYEASTLVVALPLADSALLRDLSERAAGAGLDVLTLPTQTQLVSATPTSRDLRDLDLTDLLGRRPITLDQTRIASTLADKRVLVTGAGGSIGSELCRQIAQFSPAKLYLLDRDESGLHSTQMSLSGRGLLDGDDVVLADIRDADVLERVFRATRPDVVFHAAALKHLPLLETYPLEAWKTNVLGTANVLHAAAGVGVETFVNISTDKAADPTSVLGYSKRVTERLTAFYGHVEPGTYVSVRFGNVLGSRGSVLHAFTAQIERGGPVTVTHPDVERYFMLIPEACQLVLEASAIGRDGEVMVLEMGEPARIADVARTLISMSGQDEIEIVYTGLRPGEKLSEDLFSRSDDAKATDNPLVTSVSVPPMHLELLHTAGVRRDDDAIDWLTEHGSARVRDAYARGAG